MKHYMLILATLLSLLIPMKSLGQINMKKYVEGIVALATGDYKTAFIEFKKLAEQEQDTIALLYLAELWANEHDNDEKGVPKDFEKAIKLRTLLAEKGHPTAQLKLAQMYHDGRGVLQDYKIAIKWYTLAAEQGMTNAQLNLGLMYRDGTGVLQDYKTALKWFTLAAKQEDSLAQGNLGYMYQEGLGVLQDYKTALKWYTLSAEQGDVEAQFNLGTMYYFGQGTLKDNVYAHMWYNISSSNGNENGAKLRNIIAEIMTSTQLKNAQKLAKECVAKNYKGC